MFKKKQLLPFYKDLANHTKMNFSSTFERTLSFTHIGNENRSIKSTRANSFIFFILLRQTWEKIAKDKLDFSPNVHNLIISDNEYATNNLYCMDEKGIVTNQQIINFCLDMVHNSVFTGNAFGFKSSYTNKPKAIINLASDQELDTFSKKAITLMKKDMKVLDMTEFPDIIKDIPRDHLSTVMISNDYAIELTPVTYNCSLVVNGIVGQKVIDELLKVKKLIEKNEYFRHSAFATSKYLLPL